MAKKYTYGLNNASEQPQGKGEKSPSPASVSTGKRYTFGLNEYTPGKTFDAQQNPELHKQLFPAQQPLNIANRHLFEDGELTPAVPNSTIGQNQSPVLSSPRLPQLMPAHGQIEQNLIPAHQQFQPQAPLSNWEVTKQGIKSLFFKPDTPQVQQQAQEPTFAPLPSLGMGDLRTLEQETPKNGMGDLRQIERNQVEPVNKVSDFAKAFWYGGIRKSADQYRQESVNMYKALLQENLSPEKRLEYEKNLYALENQKPYEAQTLAGTGGEMLGGIVGMAPQFALAGRALSPITAGITENDPLLTRLIAKEGLPFALAGQTEAQNPKEMAEKAAEGIGTGVILGGGMRLLGKGLSPLKTPSSWGEVGNLAKPEPGKTYGQRFQELMQEQPVGGANNVHNGIKPEQPIEQPQAPIMTQIEQSIQQPIIPEVKTNTEHAIYAFEDTKAKLKEMMDNGEATPEEVKTALDDIIKDAHKIAQSEGKKLPSLDYSDIMPKSEPNLETPKPKIPDTYEEASQRAHDLVAEHINWLDKTHGQGVEPGGMSFDENGNVSQRWGRESRNELWYGDFYAKNGRKPNKEEKLQLAIEHLRNGVDSTLGKIPANEEFLALEKRLEELKPKEAPKPEPTPEPKPQEIAKEEPEPTAKERVAEKAGKVEHGEKQKAEAQRLLDRYIEKGITPTIRRNENGKILIEGRSSKSNHLLRTTVYTDGSSSTGGFGGKEYIPVTAEELGLEIKKPLTAKEKVAQKVEQVKAKEPKTLDEMTKDELFSAIDKTPTGVKYKPEEYQIDWGSSRGQGKRSGKQVLGSMSDSPYGIKTYQKLLANIPEYINHKDWFKGMDASDINLYLKAREYGLNHFQAKIYYAVKKGKMKTSPEKTMELIRKWDKEVPPGYEQATDARKAEAQAQKATSAEDLKGLTLDEMIKLPEVQEAKKAVLEAKSTAEINTPERQALRENITNELYGEGAKNKNKRIDLVIGPPAAGKSSVLAEPLAKKHGSLIIDSDMAKEKLPEFNNGLGAGAVHEESSDIADAIFERALENGDNIVYPLVGKTLSKLQALRNKLTELGYDVHLSLNEIPIEEAAKRAITRFYETGRFVDPEYVLSIKEQPLTNYDILKKEGGFKSYERYDNNVPRGQQAKLIESIKPGENEVHSGTMGGYGRGQGVENPGSNIGEAETGKQGITWTTNPEKRGVEIRFPDRVDAQTSVRLKANGFRYSSSGGDKRWYARDTEKARKLAQELAGEAKTEAPRVEVKAEETKPAEPQSSVKLADWLDTVSRDDIDFEFAARAHNWNSMNPDRAAKFVQESYYQAVEAIYNKLKPFAKSPEQEQLLVSELDRFKEGYLKRYREWISAKGRTASSMVTGPARFPVAKNQRALSVEAARNQELVDWYKNAERVIKKKLDAARTPEMANEDAFNVIKKDADEVIAINRARQNGDNQAFGGSTSLFASRLRTQARNGNEQAVSRILAYIKEKQTELKRPIFAKNNSIWELLKEENPVVIEKPVGAKAEQIEAPKTAKERVQNKVMAAKVENNPINSISEDNAVSIDVKDIKKPKKPKVKRSRDLAQSKISKPETAPAEKIWAIPDTSSHIVSKTKFDSPFNRVKDKVKSLWDRVYTKVVDNKNRIGQMTREAEKINGKLYGENNPYVLAQNATDTDQISRFILEENMQNSKGEIIGKSLKEIYKNVKTEEQLKLVDAYEVARHAETRIGRGEKVYPDEWGVDTPEKAKAIADDIERKHPWVKEVFNDLKTFDEQLGKSWLVDTGIISPETWGAWRTDNPFYVSNERYFDPMEKPNKFGRVKQSFANQTNPVKKSSEYGSQRPIYSPMETRMERVEKYIKVAKYNEVMQSIDKVIDLNPEALEGWIQKVDTKEGLKGGLVEDINQTLATEGIDGVFEKYNQMFDDVFNAKGQKLNTVNTVTGMVDGKPVHFKVHDPALLEALSNLKPQAQNDILQAIGQVTRVMKLLTTGANPMFSLFRNIFRDIPTAFTYSHTTSNPFRFGYDLVESMVKVLFNPNDPILKSYRAMGGGHSSSVASNRNLLAESKARIMPGYATKHPIKTGLGAVERFTNALETAPRLGEYKRTVKQGGNTYASRVQGLYNANDVTVKFKRSGNLTKGADNVLPYINAAVQGLDKLAREMKGSIESPAAFARFSGKAFFAVTLPNIVLYAYNHDNPDYQKTSNYIKDNYYLIPNPYNKGDAPFIKIPKSRELGVVFGSLPERTMRYWWDNDPEAFKDFTETIKNNFSPPTRTIAAPINDLRANKDFVDRAIVPTSMKNANGEDKILPEMQYDSKTSEVSKWIAKTSVGRHFELSPMQLDYLAKSYLGVLAQFGLPATTKDANVMDVVKRQLTVDPTFSNDIMNDFYDKIDKLTVQYNTNNLRVKQGDKDIPQTYSTQTHSYTADKPTELKELEKAKKELDKLRSEEKALMDKKDISKEEREAKIREVRQKQLDFILETNQKK